jgi:FkbM family methyltransferase
LSIEQHADAVHGTVYEHEFMAMKKCKHGAFLYNKHDSFVGQSLDRYGEWCESELLLLGQGIKPGQLVIDVGANIGTHTIFFAKAVSEQGLILAFEPQRLAYQNLCANIALNALMNVIACQQGVGKRAETIHLPRFDPRIGMNFGAISMRGHVGGEPVQVIRLDDLGLGRCHLIKVDVEGMECDVLEGARQTIAKYRPILFVENNTVEGAPAIISLLDSLEYDAYWHICGYFNPSNFFGNQENIFASYRPEANLLCLHRSVPANIEGMPKVTGIEDNWQSALARLQKPS